MSLSISLALGGSQVASSGGAPATTWDTSSLAAASFTFTNGNLTATTSTSGDRFIRGTTAKTSGTFTVTHNALDGHSATGLVAPAVTNGADWLGDDPRTIAYESTGKILKGGATLTTVATYAATDVITVVWSAGIAVFKKNGTTVYTSGDISADLPTAYPAFSTNTLSTSQGTLNATGW